MVNTNELLPTDGQKYVDSLVPKLFSFSLKFCDFSQSDLENANIYLKLLCS